jgi:uncharacterized protein YndB with AHSA1/START domain
MNVEELRPDNSSSMTLRIIRICHVDRKVVYDAWTNPKILKKWWGPYMFEDGGSKFELKIGGRIRIEVMGFDGNIYPVIGTFMEISPPERLVFEVSPLNRKGNELFKFLITVTFTPVIGETEVDIFVQDMGDGPEGDRYLGMMGGWWIESLGKLRNYFDNLK